MNYFEISLDIKKKIINFSKLGKFDELRNIFLKIPKNSIIDSEGNTILSFLTLNSLEDSASWLLMQDSNIDTSIKNKNGDTALHISIKNSLRGLTAFLTSKSSCLIKDSLNRNCLILSVINNDILTTRILIDRDFSIDEIDSYGLSALGYSFLLQNSEIASILIEKIIPNNFIFTLNSLPLECNFFPLKIQFPYKTTLLHLAILSYNMDLLIIALKYTKNLEEIDSLGNTILDLAINLNLPDFCYLLSSIGCKNKIFEFIDQNDFRSFFEVVEFLGHCVDQKGKTPLHYACLYNRKKMIEVLINKFPQLPDYNLKLPINYCSNEDINILISQKIDYGSYGRILLPLNGINLKKNRLFKILDVILHTYLMINKVFLTNEFDQFKQNNISIVCQKIIEFYPYFNRSISILKYSNDITNLIIDLNQIFYNNEFDFFLDNFNDKLNLLKQKSSDEKNNLQLILLYSNIFSWIRMIQNMFLTLNKVFEINLDPLFSKISKILNNQQLLDEITLFILSKNKIEFPIIKKIYQIF